MVAVAGQGQMCNRPADGVEEEMPAGTEQQWPAVLLNLFLGGGEDKPIG